MNMLMNNAYESNSQIPKQKFTCSPEVLWSPTVTNPRKDNTHSFLLTRERSLQTLQTPNKKDQLCLFLSHSTKGIVWSVLFCV